MSESIFNNTQRLTRAQKEANDKKWFKDQLRSLNKISFSTGSMFGLTNLGRGISDYRRMKVNYDLFNNVINKADFEHVCYPFGKEAGELPADFTNKDIISGKIKALLGMEMRRPFSWKVVATNPEATTRKEEEEFFKLKDFVINSIIAPIKQKIELEQAQALKGQELTTEEKQRIEQEVAQKLKAMTPQEVKRYMAREHQDPAEALAHQLLQYLIQKENIRMKFNKGWKHGLIAGKEIFWVGIVNGDPILKVVNPLNFDYDKSSEKDFIEDGDWACYEMSMTPSEIAKYFGSELTNVELDELYESYNNTNSLPDAAFTFREDGVSVNLGIRVIHAEWKALKPFKFIYGIDPETGEPYEDIVDESYKMNIEAGDYKEETVWIPTKYEGYQIGNDKFAMLREVPGQHKDLTNLYECKLSYIGSTYDNLNSSTTSLVDRMKYYQYFFNILWYRIELLIGSDDGKSLLLNANLIPKSSGMDFEKWMYYFKVNKIGILDPSEEGNKGNQNIGEAAKEIDMSLVSDIQKYMQLAEYIERRCGESVGITKQIEGQIGTEEAVRNTQQALVQSANILEPYFDMHNLIKRNVLQALIETAKVAYSELQPKSLSYVLDDMSVAMLTPDYELLENSTYGLFVSNSMKADETLQTMQQLSHAALQNQQVELSDVLMIMNSESTQEAEELLKVAEQNRAEREQTSQQAQQQAQQQEAEAQRNWEREKMDKEHEYKMAEIDLKGEKDIQKQLILSMGFNEDKDLDKDGMPDVLEVAKFNVDAAIKQRKQDLDEKKLEQQKKEHDDNKALEEKKIKAQVAKKINSNK
jgi:hypothetical protein